MAHYNCDSFCGFEEKTHIFSYYICKAALMYNYHNFLSWLGKDIVMHNKTERIKEYVEHLDAYLSHKGFQEAINLRLSKQPRNTSLRMFMFKIKGMET